MTLFNNISPTTRPSQVISEHAEQSVSQNNSPEALPGQTQPKQVPRVRAALHSAVPAEHEEDESGSADAKVQRKNALIGTSPRSLYQNFITLDQAGLANICYDETNQHNLVTVKRVRKVGKHPIYQLPNITSSRVVNIKDMFMDRNDVVLVYEVLDVSLRHITSLLIDPPKAFQIAVICKEVSLTHPDINLIYLILYS